MQHRQEIENLHKEILEKDKKNIELEMKVDKLEFNMNYFKNNDDFTLYYTGLPEFKYVKCIYNVIESYLPNVSAISKFTQFHIHRTTAARIFYRTINILYHRLKVSCIVWPEREEIMKNMPFCFQEHFGKRITVIIDCFETTRKIASVRIHVERVPNWYASSKIYNLKRYITIADFKGKNY
ncbi:hypothetical protein NQ315_002894 [Exocentrus adspersus]|uniref:Uncharacterized protein n=1 Tax=Exocentrus adspersus TaxID=1586481 RepID=A0AAV8VGP0_9CUCU|nr:hypothetical protein NQ315_002894 [Exocentrus adspersus]